MLSFSAKNILVAEDDPNDAFVLKRAFDKAGIHARINFVRDGEEAINYLNGEDGFVDRAQFPFPDLLLLDLKMPRLDGFDVLRWLQKRPGLNRLLVTILTSSAQPQDVNRAYDLGANSYLVKPTFSDDLVEVAEKLQSYWFRLNHCPDCNWKG